MQTKLNFNKILNRSQNQQLRPSRTLTQTFMSETRAKGLCYSCDELYAAEHSLTHMTIQIRVMELRETPLDQEFK